MALTKTQQAHADAYLERFMAGLRRRNEGQPEFHQAVEEVARDVVPFLEDKKAYKEAHILDRMTEPDRAIVFRVCWVDDDDNVRVNRGMRVQFNNAIGPYKGGLRFHKSVNISILKFLGFEQVLNPNPTVSTQMATNGLYRWVRHPLYTTGLAFIWLTPIMTMNLLALNIGLTLYLLLGTIYEERKLVRQFGEEYIQYQQEVPMLIPGIKINRSHSRDTN